MEEESFSLDDMTVGDLYLLIDAMRAEQAEILKFVREMRAALEHVASSPMASMMFGNIFKNEK